MCAEITGGYLSNSLAIMTDAAHMLSDVSAFFISIVAIHMGKTPVSLSKTYGYHRAEVLGATASIIIIWFLVLWLCIEASFRVKFSLNAYLAIFAALSYPI